MIVSIVIIFSFSVGKATEGRIVRFVGWEEGLGSERVNIRLTGLPVPQIRLEKTQFRSPAPSLQNL